MALYVKTKHGWFGWNIGQSFPFHDLERVVEMQADGDELEFLLEAIGKNAKKKVHSNQLKGANE